MRRHHFAHLVATDCQGAAETALHLLSKELISELQTLVIPQYEFSKERKTNSGRLVRHNRIVAKGGVVPIDSVRIEEHEPGFVPDIIIHSGPKALIIEIAVTHKVSRSKLRRIRRRDLPAIEIRLDPSDAFLSRDSLRTKLQSDLRSKKWLFHPAQREAERTFFASLRAAIARERANKPLLSYQVSPSPVRALIGSSFRRSSTGLLREYDRTAEEFHKKYHRYPTMEECLRLWPHLWKP